MRLIMFHLSLKRVVVRLMLFGQLGQFSTLFRLHSQLILLPRNSYTKNIENLFLKIIPNPFLVRVVV